MGILKIIILSFLFLGCTKYSELEVNKYGNYFFKTDHVHVKDIKLIPWRVGLTEKQTLTKGILFTLSFPRIRNSDIFNINEKTNADSWIIRVRRSSSLGSSVLGFLYSPFLLPGIPGIEKLRAKQIKTMTLQILYSAATLPDELLRSPCPPMNHRKYIEELYIDPQSDVVSLMTITPEMSSNLNEEITEFSYQTPTLNGGADLAGVYHFEISFFDSKNKKTLGDWFDYPETVTVVREMEASLEECRDYEPKKLGPDYHDFKRFKWKENMFKNEGK